MNRLAIAFLFIVAPVLSAAAQTGAPPRKPNLIVIYADDLGYGDLACYGHPAIRTPNLDRMAAEGMRFTDFYSAGEVCTPSRAALLTGRYPVRSGMASDRRRVLFPDSSGGLPADEITLAGALKSAGYATGMVGKWHLGHLPEFLPTSRGFDSYFGIPYSNDMDRADGAPKGRAAFHPAKSEYFQVPLMRGKQVLERAPDQSTLTRRYTDEALKFIAANRERPFFLYFAHTFPHVPLFASDEFRGKSRRGIYGDAVEELDASVGEVIEALRTKGLDENTLVFFSSDNGPWLTQLEQGGSAGLLHGGKGSTWEGGMREPAIAWWPGRIAPGAITRALSTTMDLFTTFVKLGGGELPRDRPIDGVDLGPVLFERKPAVRDAFLYYRGETLFAIRKGRFKAHVLTQAGYGQAKPEAHEPPLLYDLGVDPSEAFDLAKEQPDIAKQLQAEIEKQRKEIKPAPSQLEAVTGSKR